MMNDQKHWLVRPENIRKLWFASLAILAVTVIAELLVERHPTFAVEGGFGFNAWYGLGVCVAMILVSKVLGVLLKQPDAYYEQTEEEDGS